MNISNLLLNIRTFTLLLAIASLAACVSDGPPKSGPPVGTAEDGIIPVTLSSPANGQFTAPQPVKVNRIAQMLATNYWVFEFYIYPTDTRQNIPNRGRWYKFNLDGSFVSGHWGKTLGQGSWRLGGDDKEGILVIDSNIDSEKWEYKVTYSSEGDAMSWVGSSSFSRPAVMIKAINLMTQPTREQFGLE